MLGDTEQRVWVSSGDGAEPRQHHEVASGLLPPGARQAFSKGDALARCRQRGSVRSEWPVVGLTGKRQAGNCCEPNSRCVSIHLSTSSRCVLSAHTDSTDGGGGIDALPRRDV